MLEEIKKMNFRLKEIETSLETAHLSGDMDNFLNNQYHLNKANSSFRATLIEYLEALKKK